MLLKMDLCLTLFYVFRVGVKGHKICTFLYLQVNVLWEQGVGFSLSVRAIIEILYE